MADLVGNREGGGEAIVLDNGAGRAGRAHSAELGQAQGVAALLPRVVTEVLPANQNLVFFSL